MTLSLEGAAPAARDGAILRQYQLVQRSADSILVRIAVRPGADPGDVAASTRSAVEHELRRVGVRLGGLAIEVADTIERRGGAAKESLSARCNAIRTDPVPALADVLARAWR